MAQGGVAPGWKHLEWELKGFQPPVYTEKGSIEKILSKSVVGLDGIQEIVKLAGEQANAKYQTICKYLKQ